jgi:hypothetical protein
MTPTVFVVLFLVLAVAATMYLSRFLTMRAMRTVVSVFREKGATDAKSARSLQELGLVRANLLNGMFKGRDYRPQALRLLGQAEIIRATEGGKFYLSEHALENSRIKDMARIK